MISNKPTDKYRKRLAKLKTEYDSNWKNHYVDISNYLMTRKGRFIDKDDTTPNDGKKRNSNVLDGTGGRALRILAAGMQSGLTSPARPWFRLGLIDKGLQEFKPVRMWLDEVRRRMLAVFSRSNFYTAVHSVYGELGGFGTSSMLIDEDYNHVIRCYPFTVGEYYLGTDPTLRVDTFYRVYNMTAKNLVEKFGKDQVSDTVRLQATEHKDQWHKVVHCVEPNFDRKEGVQDAANKAWTSVYFEYNENTTGSFLRESGYNTFPIMAPRWDTTGSEVYGRSPGMDTLPDVMMLQKMQEKALKALDKLVDPPMNAPSSMKEKGGTIISGGVNYIDTMQGQQGFTPTFQVNPDFQAIEYKIERVQTAIKEGFFNDLFLMLALSGNKEMTAREVAERHEEKLLTVGPVVERLQPELLDRVVDRTYDIMDENGLIPEAPSELEGMEVEVEYISLLAQAQKMVGTSAIEQTVNFVGGLVEVWPEARHKFDAIQAVDEYSDMMGVPARIIRGDKEVQEQLDAEAQEAGRVQQMEEAQQMAQGGKTLSETDMDSNSALKALLEGSQGEVV